MAAQKYNKNEKYDTLNKYLLSYVSKTAFEGKDNVTGAAACKARLGEFPDLVQRLDVEKTPLESIVEPEFDICERVFKELKVTDALQYVKAPKEIIDGFKGYSNNLTSYLFDGCKKYLEANKTIDKAKNKKENVSTSELLKAVKEMHKYEKTATDYKVLQDLFYTLATEKTASKIADYKRKQMGFDYKKQEEQKK